MAIAVESLANGRNQDALRCVRHVPGMAHIFGESLQKRSNKMPMKRSAFTCKPRRLLIFLLMAVSPVFNGLGAGNGVSKMVFAHYMVALPTGGPKSTVDDFKTEISSAQNAGIDGFALNCGGWSILEPHYKERVLKIYQAAQELGTDFKLFISADFATKLTFDEFKDMVESFRNHPNQFRHDGKPVISTFDRKRNLTESVAAEFQGDKGIVFVPFYYPVPAVEIPDDAAIRSVLDADRPLDGFFYFGAAGTPDQISDVIRRMARVWRGAGKIFMAPVTPYYRGKGKNNRVFETRGFEGMAKEWEAILESGADWVEITTWNDFGECSYIAPFGLPKENGLWRGDWGTVISHAGYLEANKYFIQWYKTGDRPDISSDSLCYFYRLHPKTLQTNIGKPRHGETLEDSIFVTAFLKAPGELTISCGQNEQTFNLRAGVSHVSLPMRIGRPRFSLERGGKGVLAAEGEYAISDENIWADYNYFSGFVKAQAAEK